MLRVPGTDADLFQIKGAGGMCAWSIRRWTRWRLPRRILVNRLCSLGWDSRPPPGHAMSVHVAKRRGLKNFSLLVSHVLVPPAIAAILESPGNKVQAFCWPATFAV